MAWLQGVGVDRSGANATTWPWTLPAVRDLDRLDLDHGITFFTGQNGTGKSTVLEAVAVSCGCPVAGGGSPAPPEAFPTTGLDGWLRPVLAGAPPAGAWFVPAQTFLDLASAGDRVATAHATDADARLLGAFGWRPPHDLPHLPSFLGLFEVPTGAGRLWFLDDPEAPLSFRGQLALLTLLAQQVEAGSQFVIATHSPVLLSLPGAVIHEFGDDGIHRREWEELELVQEVRGFLDQPNRYLGHLFP